MLFFHTYKSPGLVCDIIEDIRLMNDQAMKAAPRKTGVIILGGGEGGWAAAWAGLGAGAGGEEGGAAGLAGCGAALTGAAALVCCARTMHGRRG